MLIDLALDLDDAASAPAQAQAAEAGGYAGFVVSETRHDPFLPLVQAAGVTQRIELATAIAIAFARTPMTLANIGYDLQRISSGRFTLGLGSQIKPHVENRYSMPWGKPVSRMREFLAALRAIWSSWEEDKPLDFRGEYYTHTLMTPMFTPPRHDFGAPRIRLAAVGSAMTEAAGELADGVICHAFTSPEFLREVTRPAVARGAEKAGRPVEGFEYTGLLMMGLASSDADYEQAARALRKQIGFYASTPAYRAVLDAHGWGDLQPVLRDLSKAGEWDEIGRRITDEMLDTFALLGTPEDVAARAHQRYGQLLDRVSVYAPQPPTSELLHDFVHHANNHRS